MRHCLLQELVIASADERKVREAYPIMRRQKAGRQAGRLQLCMRCGVYRKDETLNKEKSEEYFCPCLGWDVSGLFEDGIWERREKLMIFQPAPHILRSFGLLPQK